MPKFIKKLIQFQENTCTDGSTEGWKDRDKYRKIERLILLDPSGYCQGFNEKTGVQVTISPKGHIPIIFAILLYWSKKEHFWN